MDVEFVWKRCVRHYDDLICLNPDNLDLRGDVNGDCKINLYDLAVIANGWLNDGMAVIP